MTVLRVHVTPRSDRNAVTGWRGDELSVRVTAPPDAGKANLAVCKVVSDALSVPKGSVSVVRGHTSRHKTLQVQGVDQGDMTSVFGAPADPLF